jgi:uncharacterized membrane protein YhaH (DUF805 family)
MKRILPMAIAIAAGLIVLADFFVYNPHLHALQQTLVDWALILTAFALILGLFNVLAVHFKRIKDRQQRWRYSPFLIVALVVVLVFGLLDIRGPEGNVVRAIFWNLIFPVQATIASLLAFYVASAAYRAFRARSLESAVVLAVGVIVLLGQVPVGVYLWDRLPTIKAWILEVPTTAGARGIILGVALGTVATGLRVLLGIDRPYSE